jgi:hypothetical protein
MVYRNIKHFNPVDKVFIEYQDQIIRRMACDILMHMAEEDFIKLFQITISENNFMYYDPTEVEVKLIVK